MTALSYPEWFPPDAPDLTAYIASLDRLENRDAIPAAVLGAARYVISPRPPSLVNRADVLATLALVTDDFWRAAADVHDGFDWPILHPNDVRCGPPDFGVQWRIVSRLFVVLQSAGAEGSKRTDVDRRKAADDIIASAKKLRAVLDATTGHDPDGDWLGLHRLDAYGLLKDAGATHAGERFGIAPSSSWHDDKAAHAHEWGVLKGLTLQDLLTEAIARTEWQAEHVETDGHGHPRQARFVKALRTWLQEAHVICCGETTKGVYWPCVHTADAILEARHPEVSRVANPARGKHRP